MDMEYRNLLAPNGSPLIPQGDFRTPSLPRPVEFMQRSPESGEMDKTPPVTGKRRGGSRKACNECKQQKVSQETKYDSNIADHQSPCSEDVFPRRESSAVATSRPVSVAAEPHPSIGTPLAMKRSGSIISQDENTPWRLEDVVLSRARVARLYDHGLMMQIAMQLGLHRPVQSEEFTTFRMEVQGEALKDLLPLGMVNRQVQCTTGPSNQRLSRMPIIVCRMSSPFRLRIEKFCDRVTKALYSSKPEPVEFISPEKLIIIQILENELRDMEVEFRETISAINMIHLRAAELHFRYFVFLGSNARSDDLSKLFIATTSFLGRVLDLETSPGELIGHATNYILQMIVSAAFALMKLLRSSFNRNIDFNHGKLLFNGAISAIRRISVMDHDRPIRLADILAQMWNATSPEPAEEDNLQLKIRCRMSMSHVYDTVWRWRQRFRPLKSIEEMQGKSSMFTGAEAFAYSLAAAAAVANQDITSTMGPLTQQQDNALADQSMMLPPQFDEGGAFFTETGFSEVFDSLNWVFEGIPDSFVAPPVL
ncbi:hypothetical protein N7470_007015 [Penicillium chermesinum]|nr:hypothetical protein N7470_007015 [Penicillium chermesinum]